MDERDLSKAKVGDYLIVQKFTNGTCAEHLEKVTEITKGGNVKTDKGNMFYSNGRMRGQYGNSQLFADIATEQDIERVKRKIFVAKTLKLLHSLPYIEYNDAVKVVKILSHQGNE